jgi:ankyrin repeat protein
MATEVRILKMLLKAGADPNLLDCKNSSPLSRAIERSDLSMVKSLLSHGAMVGLKRVYKEHDIFLATRKGNLVRVKFLFKAKPEAHYLNYRDNSGNTLMHLASEYGHPDLMEFLIKRGAEINRKNHEGNTPLHLSVSNRKRQAVALLLMKGVDINARNNSGETPLHLSIWSTVMIEKLLDVGADIDARDNFGDTPLNHAVESDCLQGAEKLVHLGADLDARGFYGQTALHKACNSKELIHMLLNNKAETEAADDFGNTPIIATSEHGSVDALKLLIEKGANVNAVNDLGDTSLHRAVERRASKMVVTLLKSGARPDRQNNVGVTPLHLAADCIPDADHTVTI